MNNVTRANQQIGDSFPFRGSGSLVRFSQTSNFEIGDSFPLLWEKLVSRLWVTFAKANEPVWVTTPGPWSAFFFDPVSGRKFDLGTVQVTDSWKSPNVPSPRDWVLVLLAEKNREQR